MYVDGQLLPHQLVVAWNFPMQNHRYRGVGHAGTPFTGNLCRHNTKCRQSDVVRCQASLY